MAGSPRSILVDAGPLIALGRKQDLDHERAVAFARTTSARFITTWPVLTEVAHFLSTSGRLALYSLVESGSLTVKDLRTADAGRLREITERYPRADLADASLVVLAERLRMVHIATLDQRDFSAYRTRAGRAFINVFA